MVFLVGLAIILVVGVITLLFLWASEVPLSPAVLVFFILLVLWTGIMSVSPISRGHVGVAQWFGAVQPGVYPEGLRWMPPMYDVTQTSIQRASVDFTDKSKSADGPAVVAVSLDRNPVRIEVSFPYALNPTVAWKMLQRIGTRDEFERQLVIPAARASVRDVVAQYAWADASIAKRTEVEARLLEETSRAVVGDLKGLGFTETEAKSAVTFLPVLLREILPDEKVLNAIAERVASEEDLKRQKILTSIAEEIAERRANEGVGVERLFSKLPTGFKPSEIKEVLLALAEKERADAMMKAVEGGKINLMVLPSSNSIAITALHP